MSRGYITPQTLADLRATLTTNDWAVLEDVSVMRLAAATDLQRLQELRSPLGVRQFRRQLQQLADQRVLFRLERTVGGRNRGSASFIYVVGGAGQRLLALDVELPIRRAWTPRPSWLSHALAAGHLYVTLRELDVHKHLRLLSFEAEPRAWRSFSDSDGPAILKPDAAFVVEQGEYVDSYFIEVDCATESPATLERKCDVYRRYWQSGAEQGAHGVFPRVLWLVPSERRLRVVRQVTDRQNATAALHQVALYDDIARVVTEEPP